jgi:hypothetical protein
MTKREDRCWSRLSTFHHLLSARTPPRSQARGADAFPSNAKEQPIKERQAIERRVLSPTQAVYYIHVFLKIFYYIVFL